MKKRLRQEISDLAAQILSKEKEHTTTSLKETARALYERATLLEFLESQDEGNIRASHKDSLDSKSYREENWFKEPDQLPQQENKEEIIEPVIEKIKDIVAQMPSDTHQVDSLLDELLPEDRSVKNELEEFAATYQETPIFERKESDNGNDTTENSQEQIKAINTPREKLKSINDSHQKGLSIGLNDRIAFINHLFEGDAEDYTRVISQIETFDSFSEVVSFINDKVKPDYNNWKDKEVYSERFLSILERSFSV